MNCTQPGCSGEIADGYCNLCGMAPTPSRSTAGAAPVTASGTTQGRGSGTTQARGSNTTALRRAGSGTTRTRVSHRRSLGLGLVEVPPVPYQDPLNALMADATVTESRRFCARCRDPVGRGRDGFAGSDRRLLPLLRGELLVHAKAECGRGRGDAVRGGGVSRARWAGMDLPRQGPQRGRSLGCAEGAA